jgi:hypothetical protein
MARENFFRLIWPPCPRGSSQLPCVIGLSYCHLLLWWWTLLIALLEEFELCCIPWYICCVCKAVSCWYCVLWRLAMGGSTRNVTLQTKSLLGDRICIIVVQLKTRPGWCYLLVRTFCVFWCNLLKRIHWVVWSRLRLIAFAVKAVASRDVIHVPRAPTVSVHVIDIIQQSVKLLLLPCCHVKCAFSLQGLSL